MAEDTPYAQTDGGALSGVSARTQGLIDINGVWLLVASVSFLLFLIVAIIAFRWVRSRGKMSSMLKGRLRYAAACGNVALLEAIKDSAGSTFDVDSSLRGFTTLHAASAQGEAGAVLWLCQNGADLEAVRSDGWGLTPLMLASSRGHLLCVKILIAFGANSAAEDSFGNASLKLASENSCHATASFLSEIKKGGAFTGIPRKDGLLDKVYIKSDNTWLLFDKNDERYLEKIKADEWMEPAFDGYGTPGTEKPKRLRLSRLTSLLSLAVFEVYIVWRALRSLQFGLGFIYSAIFWFCEFANGVMGHIFFMSMWQPALRPERNLREMLPQDENLPKVDVLIATFTEDRDVVEPTAIAAINMDYPGDKLSVIILDDGNRAEMAKMVKDLRSQMRYVDRRVTLKYVARTKKKGVDHHAKSGNINNGLFRESSIDTDYILVLDADMIVHPDFLARTVGHMYRQNNDDDSLPWKKKKFCALLQTPQDFWNVHRSDPMVHCARFFYGPMLQGRDGIGASPCCGTGAVFNRKALVSIGGQSFGSITEDYFTAMELLACGFTSMFVNERLAHGMAPSTISAVFAQRFRWALGSLQILTIDNPLLKAGLTFPQSCLFFEASAYHFMAYPYAMFAISPLVYLYSGYAPILVSRLWEFVLYFGCMYFANRIAMLVLYRTCMGASLELWRGSQLSIWLIYNNIRATLKYLLWSLLRFFKIYISIQFRVTRKTRDREGFWINFLCVWPYIAYILVYIGGLVHFIVFAAKGSFNAAECVIYVSVAGWGLVMVLYMWPPIETLIPRRETENGWRIAWDPFYDPNAFQVDENNRLVKKFSKLFSLRTSDDGVARPEKPKPIVNSQNAMQVALESLSKVHATFSPTFEGEEQFEMSPFAVMEYPEEEEAEYNAQLDALESQPATKGGSGGKHSPKSRRIKNLVSNLSSQERLDHESPFHAVNRDSSFSFLHSSRQGSQTKYHAGGSNSSFGRVALPSKSIESLSYIGPFSSTVLPEPKPSRGNEVDTRMVSVHIDKEASSMEIRPASKSKTGSIVFGSMQTTSMPPLSSQQIVKLTSLRSGSFIMPVVPAYEYEHTIAARPNFDDKHLPAKTIMFFLVNGFILIGMFVGGVLFATLFDNEDLFQ